MPSMRAPLTILMIGLLAATDASAQGRSRFVQGGGTPNGGSASSGGSVSAPAQGGGQPRAEAPPSARAAVPRESRPASNPAPRIASTPRNEVPRQDSGGYPSERSATRRAAAPTPLG